MKKTMITALVAASVLTLSAPVSAGSWMFRRSYYSHDPVRPVQIGQRPVRGPVYTRPQGDYVRGGYRSLHGSIRIGGNTYDHYHIWDSWIQHGAQR